MNRFLYLLASVASAYFMASCSNSEDSDIIEDEPVEMSFMVASPASETRAVVVDLDSQNPTVYWEETDKINVWGQGSTKKWTFVWNAFDIFRSRVKFTGKITSAKKYWIMYPNQSDASFDGAGVITATIPPYQKAVAGSFDPAAAICTALSKGQDDTSISIMHACAFLKITTTQPCYSVTVSPVGTSSDGKEWLMTGSVNILTSSSASKISLEGSRNANPFVKLTADGTANCTSTFPAGTYLIAIASSTKFPGIDITVDYGLGDNNPHVSNSPEEGLQFKAAYIYNLGIANVN